MRALVLLAFFFSGFTSLVLENLWMRLLVKVFGGTTLAIVTILTAFMGGLALGSFAAGRVVDRVKRPLVMYGLLEGLIVLYALCLPMMIGWLPQIYAWLPQDWPFYATALLRFGLSLCLLVIPTACMGATLPVLSRYVAQNPKAVGFDVGLLYSLNTFGAVLGSLVGGFVLLPLLGNLHTLWAVCGGLSIVALGMVGLGWNRTVPVVAKEPETVQETDPTADESAASAAEETLPATGLAARQTRVLLWCIAITGAVAMICQVLWSRVLTLVIGSSTYAFSLILGIFLIGLAAGALWGAWLSKRQGRDPQGLWARLLLWTAISIGLGNVALGYLPAWFGQWLFALKQSGKTSALTMYALKALAAGIPLLPSTFLMGAFFPLALAAYTQRQDKVGESVGRLYAANTFGSIVGSALAGFVVIPLWFLGLQRGLALCVTLYLLCAWLLRRFGTPEQRLRYTAYAIVGVALVWMAPRWDVSRMSAGFFRVSMFKTHTYQQILRPWKTLYYKEGISATVTVQASSRTDIFMKINGKVDASSRGDSPTQMGLSALPLMTHPNPKDVMVIGWGSGMTAGAALRFPIRRLTAIELEPAVIEASRYFQRWNLRPMRDKRLKLVYNDALNHLAVNPSKYDVIISQPSNPWLSGVANLFTTDFFELSRRKLRPKGILCQWLPIYELSLKNILSILHSLRQSYPYLMMFEAEGRGSDVLVLASQQPFHLNPSRIQKLLRTPSTRRVFSLMKVRDVHDLLTRFVMDQNTLPVLLKHWPAPLNTYNHNILEFTSPLDLIGKPVKPAEGKRFMDLISQHGRDVRKHLHFPKQAQTKAWQREFWGALTFRALQVGRLRSAKRYLDSIRQSHPQHPRRKELGLLLQLMQGKEKMGPQGKIAWSKQPSQRKATSQPTNQPSATKVPTKATLELIRRHRLARRYACLQEILPITQKPDFAKGLSRQHWFLIGDCFLMIEKYPDALYAYFQFLQRAGLLPRRKAR